MEIKCVKDLAVIPESYMLKFTESDKEAVKEFERKAGDETYKVYCQKHGFHYLVKSKEGKETWVKEK